jgi:hypothetical protein
VSEYVYTFAAALLAAALAAGTTLLAPPRPARLELARASFCFAAFCLAAIAITFVATGAVTLWQRLSVGAISGLIIGFLVCAMWLGIDKEILEAEESEDGW